MTAEQLEQIKQLSTGTKLQAFEAAVALGKPGELGTTTVKRAKELAVYFVDTTA
jgi:hypothetical protein